MSTARTRQHKASARFGWAHYQRQGMTMLDYRRFRLTRQLTRVQRAIGMALRPAFASMARAFSDMSEWLAAHR